MELLIVDMDDVTADATGQFINYYEKEFGVRIEREILNGKGEGPHNTHFSRLNNWKEVGERFL